MIPLKTVKARAPPEKHIEEVENAALLATEQLLQLRRSTCRTWNARRCGTQPTSSRKTRRRRRSPNLPACQLSCGLVAIADAFRCSSGQGYCWPLSMAAFGASSCGDSRQLHSLGNLATLDHLDFHQLANHNPAFSPPAHPPANPRFSRRSRRFPALSQQVQTCAARSRRRCKGI